MSDQSETDAEHTLLIVEEDVLDESEAYEVAKLGHSPDSRQVKAVKKAMRQLLEVATEETGTPHRLVTESGDPETVQSNYAMHAAAAEKSTDD